MLFPIRQFTYKTPNVVSPGIPQFTYETPNVVSPGIPQYTQTPPQKQTQTTTNQTESLSFEDESSTYNPRTPTLLRSSGVLTPFDPFQPDSKTFAIYIEPIRNTYYKTYQHVITFDAPPAGPLAKMVLTINTPPLSEFHQRSTFSSSPPTRNGGRCVHVLSRYPKGSPNANPKHSNVYMSPRDIPALYGFLQTNGYTIDTTLTKMTYQTNTASYMMMDDDNGYGQRKLVAISTYSYSSM
jgi:hypothetical protein